MHSTSFACVTKMSQFWNCRSLTIYEKKIVVVSHRPSLKAERAEGVFSVLGVNEAWNSAPS